MQILLFVIKIKHRQLVSRIICGAFVGIIALWILPTVYRGFRDGPRSTEWPMIEGTILEHRIVPLDRDGTDAELGVKLVYQYEVNGEKYSGSRINVANNEIVFHGQLAQELQLRCEEKFPKNGPIEIFYDPNQPSQAVLITGTVPSTYGQLLFVIFIVAAYLFYLARSDRQRRRAHPDPSV